MTIRLAASPCSHPQLPLDKALAMYAELGFSRFEAFTSWVNSALDWKVPPAAYHDLARKFGMTYCSLHLPAVRADDVNASLDEAVAATDFASRLGAAIVLFKADSTDTYARAASEFLDRIADYPVTPVLQNHAGSPISRLSDMIDVTQAIDDARMRVLLEIGHYHAVGDDWHEALSRFADRIALVHVKDMAGGRCVPFGEGDIDLCEVVGELKGIRYCGDVVLEAEIGNSDLATRTLGEAIAMTATEAGVSR